MGYANIVFDLAEDGIALIKFNRPQKLNALNRDTVRELDDVVARAESEAAVRALILTGEGEKAFVAGADIQELAALDPVAARESSLYGQRVFRRLEVLPKPSVAAINGYALGGGLELAMSCTLRVASAAARLGQPEVKLGIIPGYGGTQRLPRLVGRGRALEMLLTGEPVGAAEAHRIGLVNHVVQPEELLPFCCALMRKILDNGPAAVALAVDVVDRGLGMSLEDGLHYEASGFAISAATEDRSEGMRAFLEKRKPAFKGK